MRTRKKRAYNGRLFKAKSYYDFGEVAEILSIHLRTVQAWKKEGLRPLDDKKPTLVSGQTLRDFLKARRQDRKRPLKIGEFYCFKCREPRKSHPDRLTALATQRRLGKTQKQVLLRGICGVCGQSLLRFSSEQKAAEWLKNGLIFTGHQQRINSSETGSVKTDILKGRENGKSKRQE